MKLTLATDEGILIGEWYIDDENVEKYQGGKRGVQDLIDNNLPVYDSKKDYEEDCE